MAVFCSSLISCFPLCCSGIEFIIIVVVVVVVECAELSVKIQLIIIDYTVGCQTLEKRK